MPTSHYYYNSELGELYLSLSGETITALQYEPEKQALFTEPLPQGRIKKWLDDYFSGHTPRERLNVQPSGTEFQQKIWDALLQIPYGDTMTYGEMAGILKSAPRAVGQACRRNPVPIMIPCHRVVGRQSIGGYEGATAGHRLDRKSWLLRHERA